MNSCEDDAPAYAGQQFEYKFKSEIVFHAGSIIFIHALKEALNALGAEGWELVTITPDGAWFKRRKEAA